MSGMELCLVPSLVTLVVVVMGVLLDAHSP